MWRVPGNDMKPMLYGRCRYQPIGNRYHCPLLLPGGRELAPYLRRFLIQREDAVLKPAGKPYPPCGEFAFLLAVGQKGDAFRYLANGDDAQVQATGGHRLNEALDRRGAVRLS